MSFRLHGRRGEAPAFVRPLVLIVLGAGQHLEDEDFRACRRAVQCASRRGKITHGGAAMPIHDWTRVDAGLYHDFHQDWTVEICRALNRGRLPPGFAALIAEQTPGPTMAPGHFVEEAEEDTYARRANRIRIQHRHGQIVAV